MRQQETPSRIEMGNPSVEQINRAVLDFAGGQPQFDDITVMVLKCLPQESDPDS
ncbi:hypothetical protein ACFLXE_07470 [Chloroflexota bacterium]